MGRPNNCGCCGINVPEPPSGVSCSGNNCGPWNIVYSNNANISSENSTTTTVSWFNPSGSTAQQPGWWHNYWCDWSWWYCNWYLPGSGGFWMPHYKIPNQIMTCGNGSFNFVANKTCYFESGSFISARIKSWTVLLDAKIFINNQAIAWTTNCNYRNGGSFPSINCINDCCGQGSYLTTNSGNFIITISGSATGNLPDRCLQAVGEIDFDINICANDGNYVTCGDWYDEHSWWRDTNCHSCGTCCHTCAACEEYSSSVKAWPAHTQDWLSFVEFCSGSAPYPNCSILGDPCYEGASVCGGAGWRVTPNACSSRYDANCNYVDPICPCLDQAWACCIPYSGEFGAGQYCLDITCRECELLGGAFNVGSSCFGQNPMACINTDDPEF